MTSLNKPSKYRVRLGSIVFQVVEVEAANEEEAEEIALRESSIEEPIVEGIEKL